MRPRLLYYRRSVDYRALADFIQLHYEHQVECMAQYFDVHVIDYDCDHRAACKKYEPDLVLVDGGYASGAYRTLNVENVGAFPEIPRVGFYNADPFCRARAAFMSQMMTWGIDTYFSISVALARYVPDVADRVITWPNAIAGDLFRDYGSEKAIDVFLTGSDAEYYPWRRRVWPILKKRYRAEASPHFGYYDSGRMPFGQQYAALLNSAWFVPTCGNVAHDVVRKHFEIPACRACLVTERTPALEEAGFEDMVNCLFADTEDIVDKIDALLANPDRLRGIIDAGYELVHGHHTLRHRNQLRQWFDLYKHVEPGERIVQDGPFGALRIVARNSPEKTRHVAGDSQDRHLVRAGDSQLRLGHVDGAAAAYAACQDLFGQIPQSDVKLRLAICKLYQGDAKAGLDLVVDALRCALLDNAASTPDPVEWAYFLVALACCGRIAEASERASLYPDLTHGELERARCLIRRLSGSSDASCPTGQSGISIHRLPSCEFADWMANARQMLRACGQVHAAQALDEAPDSGPAPRVVPRRRVKRLHDRSYTTLLQLCERWAPARRGDFRRERVGNLLLLSEPVWLRRFKRTPLWPACNALMRRASTAYEGLRRSRERLD